MCEPQPWPGIRPVIRKEEEDATEDRPQPLVRHRGRAGRRVLHLGIRQFADPQRHPLHRVRARRDRDGDEAVSFEIECETQDEIDYFWRKLTEGGEESQCGWLKDRFGLSWQVVPTGMEEVFADPDPERADRAMKAMLQMRKIDLAALSAAAEGAPKG
jgi:hypothetical protein